MHLLFHLVPAPVLAHEGGIDFVVEVTDVAYHSPLFQSAENGRITYVGVTGTGHQNVSVLHQPRIDVFDFSGVDAALVRGHHFVAIHAGLHCANWIDLSHADDHALLAQTLGRALADIAVADD